MPEVVPLDYLPEVIQKQVVLSKLPLGLAEDALLEDRLGWVARKP